MLEHPVRSTALPPLRTSGSLAATAACLLARRIEPQLEVRVEQMPCLTLSVLDLVKRGRGVRM
jgi:hypothetical protein